MQGKFRERALAVELRKRGKTYSEILNQIHVAKSTLSLWLRSVGMAAPQKQRITEKRLESQRRGAARRREIRLLEVDSLSKQGKFEIGNLSDRELWLVGIALYWAEGSKQNLASPSSGVMIGNSDPRMLALFLRWLKKQGIPKSSVSFELYVHENRKSEISAFIKWWATQLNIKSELISRVYLKRSRIKTNRTNVKDLYHGLLRIKVASSTLLNRKISGWVDGIGASWGIV